MSMPISPQFQVKIIFCAIDALAGTLKVFEIVTN